MQKKKKEKKKFIKIILCFCDWKTWLDDSKQNDTKMFD